MISRKPWIGLKIEDWRLKIDYFRLKPQWNFPRGALFHGVKIEGPQITQIARITCNCSLIICDNQSNLWMELKNE